VFGAPVANAMHAQSAVRCALEIQRRISRLNGEGKFGEDGIKVGIGINTGEMVAGNLGSPRRMEYTVIGDNVNVASRITSIAKEGEILISGSTYDLAVDGGEFRFEEMGRVTVRGRSEGVRIYKVVGSGKEES
ncbi:MAG: adenylate/guanylate cyclase domain-containing protein, partial [Deltaproteobacteria bacterium]|nr:adenylate/guanylate cyclase domain-containing protein [Deltaproteobacteria bacterium]